MSLLFWLLSISAGYYLTRHSSPWMTVLPTGLALLAINHFDPLAEGGSRFVGFFLLFALLLVGRLTFLRNRSAWQSEGIFFTSENGEHLSRATLILSLVLVGFAWFTPALSTQGLQPGELWATITQPWNDLRTRLSGTFSSLQGRPVSVSDYFGTDMALGTGTHLGDETLFQVRSSLPPIAGIRYYWRARSYDSYLDGNWSSSITEQHTLTPDNFDIAYPDWTGRRPVTFSFTTRANLQNVPTGPLPTNINWPVQALIGSADKGTVDLAGMLARPPLTPNIFYNVTSSISDPTVPQIRGSGTDYPAWVTQRYLQLPVQFSARINDLAHTITAGMNNPYDETVAITRYLRQNITYKETLPPLPANKDLMEWFLFDIKQGYCNYYATAEVLMLRAVGVPARLTAGYAEGTYDSQLDLYLVRQKDSHAWPEVFFNGIGWVEFEPTVSQPDRTITTGGSTEPTPISPIFGGSTGSSGGPFIPTPDTTYHGSSDAANQLRAAQLQKTILIIAILALLIGGLAFWYLRYAMPRLKATPLPVMLETSIRKRKLTVPGWIERWSQRARLSPFEKAFGIMDHAHWVLGKRAQAALTPAERVDSLIELLPEALKPARVLLTEYHQAEFSPHPANLATARSAGAEIRWLAYRAFFRRHLTNKR